MSGLILCMLLNPAVSFTVTKRFVKALQQNSVFWLCTKIRTAWNEVRLICEKIISNEIPLDSNSLVKYYMLDKTNNIKSSTKKLQTYIQKEKQKLFAKVWGLLKYVEDRESIIWQFSSFSWEFWINEDFQNAHFAFQSRIGSNLLCFCSCVWLT